MKNKQTPLLNPQKPTKIIEVGKFYLIHDGSPSGHPGYIIWKDDARNLYLAIKFGSSPSNENKKFSYPLSNEIANSYYYKRLFLGKRKNFGSLALTKLTILEKDLTALLENFDFLNPKYSQDIHRKDKRYYKWTIKNPL